jgi:peptidoglycan/LPS O-acetylase OafA/YrhL
MEALTTVRFFAAFYVLLYHIWAGPGLAWTPPWFQTFASAGFTGVTFFFVLSGFIFVYTYADKPLSLRGFWRARLARIYPSYLLSLLVMAPLFFNSELLKTVPEQAWAINHRGITAILNILMVQSWFPQTSLTWNEVNWSVSVEIFFYSLFPWLRGPISRLSKRELWRLGVGAWVVSITVAVLYTVIAPDGPVPPNGDDHLLWIRVVYNNPIARLPEFLMGLALGSWFTRGEHNRKLATPLVLAGVAAVTAGVAFRTSLPLAVQGTGLLAPAFAAIIAGLALRPRWIKWLEHPLLVFLGEASYVFYLLHIFVLILVCSVIYPAPSGVASPGRVVLAVSLAIGISALVHRFIDEPLRRRLRGQKPTKV